MGSPTDTANSAAGTEVATRPEPRQLVNVPLGQALENMDQAWRMAQAFAAADIVPQDLRGKPANAFLVMLYGQRLGLPPEIALSTVSVVKGRPRMSGQLLLAKVREAGHKPTIKHGDGECTVTITRGDDDTSHSETFTLDDAVTARLCKIVDGKVQARSKQGEALPWETYTRRMLMWRALGFCVDVICPEVKMGFVVEGELDGGVEHQGPTITGPALAPIAAKRATAERAGQPSPSYTCPCGAKGHYEDDCPNGGMEGSSVPMPRADSGAASGEVADAALNDMVDDTVSTHPKVDDDAMAAEMAAIEAEHRAEYGDGPQARFDFGPDSGAGEPQ